MPIAEMIEALRAVCEADGALILISWSDFGQSVRCCEQDSSRGVVWVMPDPCASPTHFPILYMQQLSWCKINGIYQIECNRWQHKCEQ